MAYIEKSLGQGEKLVARAHFHWLYTLRASTTLILLVLCVIGIAVFDRLERIDLPRPLLAGLAVLFAVWFIVGSVLFLRRMIRRWTTEIGITTHRFIIKTGLFTLHTEELAIHNIEGVRVDESFLGRIFGFGHLRVEGTGVDAIEIPTIADPIDFRRAIETAKGQEPQHT